MFDETEDSELILKLKSKQGLKRWLINVKKRKNKSKTPSTMPLSKEEKKIYNKEYRRKNKKVLKENQKNKYLLKKTALLKLKPANKAWVTMHKRTDFLNSLSKGKRLIAEALISGVTQKKANKIFCKAYVTMVVKSATEKGIKLKGLILPKEEKAIKEVKIQESKSYNVEDTPNKEVVRASIEKHLLKTNTPTHVGNVRGAIFDFFGNAFTMTKRIIKLEKFNETPLIGVEYSQKEIEIQNAILETNEELRNRVIRPSVPTKADEYLTQLMQMNIPMIAMLLDFCNGFEANKELVKKCLEYKYLAVGSLIQITICARYFAGKGIKIKETNGQLLRNLIETNGNFKFEKIEGLNEKCYAGKGSIDIPLYSDSKDKKGNRMYVCLIRKVK